MNGTATPATEEGEERVGKGRPPRATRFRPGQSGNPRGRPRRARGLGGLLATALREKVEAKENGRKRRLTKLEAAVTQLVNRAAKGDQRATQFVFALLGDEQSPPGAANTRTPWPGRRPRRRRARPPSFAADAMTRSLTMRRRSHFIALRPAPTTALRAVPLPRF